MATGKFLGSFSLNMSSFSRNPGFGGQRFLIPQGGTYKKVPTCPDCRFSSVTLKNITKPYCYLEVPMCVWLAHTLPCGVSLVFIVIVTL